MYAIETIAKALLLALMARGVTGGVTKVIGQSSVDRDRIDTEVVVKAGQDEVWDAWTTNEGVQSFFTSKTNVQLAIGGPFEMYFLDDAPKGKQGSEGCKFLSYLPKEMISFSWSAPPQFAHARKHFTWVVLRFDRIGDQQTRVRLTHLGWPEMRAAYPEHSAEWDEVYDYFAAAWPRVLTNLQARFDGESTSAPSREGGAR